MKKIKLNEASIGKSEKITDFLGISSERTKELQKRFNEEKRNLGEQFSTADLLRVAVKISKTEAELLMMGYMMACFENEMKNEMTLRSLFKQIEAGR